MKKDLGSFTMTLALFQRSLMVCMTHLSLFLVWGDEKGRDEGLFSVADQKTLVTFQFRIL